MWYKLDTDGKTPIPIEGSYPRDGERMTFGEWKTIETAPNDPDVLHYRGLWVWTMSYYGKTIPYYFQSSLGHVSDEGGHWVQSDMDDCGWGIEDFTHWHECPKLPEVG